MLLKAAGGLLIACLLSTAAVPASEGGHPDPYPESLALAI
jgi:hypothetical protein